MAKPEALTVDTLGNLHFGFARSVINNAISEALRDIETRGNDEKPRVVVVTLTLEKLSNGPVSIDVKAICKCPDYKVEPTIGNIRITDRGPVFEFKSDSPDNPGQLTLDDAPSEKSDDDA